MFYLLDTAHNSNTASLNTIKECHLDQNGTSPDAKSATRQATRAYRGYKTNHRALLNTGALTFNTVRLHMYFNEYMWRMLPKEQFSGSRKVPPFVIATA